MNLTQNEIQHAKSFFCEIKDTFLRQKAYAYEFLYLHMEILSDQGCYDDCMKLANQFSRDCSVFARKLELISVEDDDVVCRLSDARFYMLGLRDEVSKLTDLLVSCDV